MVATNSVAMRTGNVSAGTSVFAMIVLEKALSKLYPEIDMVTTPTGKPVAMVHSNNCTSDLNAWIELFQDFADMLVKEGATSVRVCATHPVLSGKAYDRIQKSKIKEVIVTDTIPLPRNSKKIRTISVAELFADVINKVYNYESISSNFIQ